MKEIVLRLDNFDSEKANEQLVSQFLKATRTALLENGKVVLDFCGVKTLTLNQADKIFGALLALLTPVEFYSKIVLVNASPKLHTIMSVAISSTSQKARL